MFIKFATNNLRAVVNNLKSNYKKYHRYGILTENIKGTLTRRLENLPIGSCSYENNTLKMSHS